MSYIPGKTGSLTWNGVRVKATSKSFSGEAGEVDYTNDASGGNFEGGTDIRKRTITFNCVVDDQSAPAFEEGTSSTFSWAVTGYRTKTGSGFITRRGEASPTRGAYTMDISITVNGAVTETAS